MKSPKSITIPAMPVEQPIGEFYIGVINWFDLLEISFADIREIERDLDNYLGIQRKISPNRVGELKEYVVTKDATFPTAIILAVEEESVTWDDERRELTLTETPDIDFGHIAKILDGQHRLEGLKALPDDAVFQLNVTIFVAADMNDQANIFATVNLAQTKVNTSLVYDLFDYAKSRSPQKTAHNVAVALDRAVDGPLQERIKRLGTRTIGRTGETLTQATVVTSLLDLISDKPMIDRDLLMRGKKVKQATSSELQSRPFRNLFIQEQDVDIAKIINNYFSAVRDRWSEAWEDRSKGNILPRTNGYRAFMRAFRPLYVEMCGDEIGQVVRTSAFSKKMAEVDLVDSDFNVTRYAPGTSGETALYNDLIKAFGVGKVGLFW